MTGEELIKILTNYGNGSTSDLDREVAKIAATELEHLCDDLDITKRHSDRYENALKWIRHIAGLHYVGDAFDPEHMRSIANLAADALYGPFGDDEKSLPDFDLKMDEAKTKAREIADRIWGDLNDDEEMQPK